MSRERELFFTATIVTFDGSDTTAAGEACEPGQGYTDESGWWDPDWSAWEVVEHQDDATPDVYDPAGADSPVEWLVERLGARLPGGAESFAIPHTFYGAGEATDGRRTLTAAGHAYGFTDDELADAVRRLGIR